jgi:transcription initiation factor TFIIIB Brf1 subunit/transcription initiation factor TFIIB
MRCPECSGETVKFDYDANANYCYECGCHFKSYDRETWVVWDDIGGEDDDWLIEKGSTMDMSSEG